MTGERTIRAWPQTRNFSSSFYWPACKALNILSVLNKGGGNSYCRAGLQRRQALQQTGWASRTYKASNGFLLYFSETGIWFSLFVSKHITSPDVTYQPALFVDSSLFYQITKLRESQHHTWLGLEHLWVPLVQFLLRPPCQPVQVSLDVFVPLVSQPLPLFLCWFLLWVLSTPLSKSLIILNKAGSSPWVHSFLGTGDSCFTHCFGEMLMKHHQHILQTVFTSSFTFSAWNGVETFLKKSKQTVPASVCTRSTRCILSFVWASTVF